MKCRVKNCSNYTSKKGLSPNVRFYLFPKDETRFHKWRLAAACGPLSIKERNCICSIHFDQEAICLEDRLTNEKPSKCKLSNTAVPTLHLPPDDDDPARIALAHRNNRLVKRKQQALVTELLQKHDEENERLWLQEEEEKNQISITIAETINQIPTLQERLEDQDRLIRRLKVQLARSEGTLQETNRKLHEIEVIVKKYEEFLTPDQMRQFIKLHRPRKSIKIKK